MESWKRNGTDEQVYDRYVAHVHSFLAGLKGRKSDDPVHAHLDRLFRELLSATVDPNRAPEEMSGDQRVAMEPLVFARLAGLLPRMRRCRRIPCAA